MSAPASPPPANDAPLRLFFALWPDAASVAALGPWIDEAHAQCGGRPMRADTLHLTLAFLGRATPAQAQRLAALTRADRIEPGELALRHYGTFPRIGIVWAGPEPEAPGTRALHRLHDHLWSRLDAEGWPRPDSPFRPHVTLLRKADGGALPQPPAEPLHWTYRDYVLVASEPQRGTAHYRVLARSG